MNSVRGRYTLENWLMFLCIIIVASILQASTGFGFSIMATPFLLMLFLPHEAIQINIVLSLLISLILIFKVKNDVDFALLKRFIIGSIIGAPLGLFIFMSMNLNTLKLGVGILLLVLTALLMSNVQIKSTRVRDFIVGGISGVLTTSIGMPGPPLLLYFTGTNTEKGKLRATSLAFYLFIFSVSLITQIFFMGTNNIVWQSSLYALPIALVGLYIGQIIFKKLNQQLFRIFIYMLLICTGVFLLIDSLGSL